jgi:hypothetical protein
MGLAVRLIPDVSDARLNSPDVPVRSNHSGRLTGATGQISGREYNPSDIGLPIRSSNLNQVKVTKTGIDRVKAHTDRFGYAPSNDYMIQRLELIANGKIEATSTDLVYYTHEIKESLRYKKLGFTQGVPNDINQAGELWNNTHTATLEDFRVTDRQLLFPEARSLEAKYEEFLYFKGERRPYFTLDSLTDPSQLISIKWQKI